MRGRQSACCFTGHRPGKLPWRYNEEDLRCVSLKARIADAVEAAYQEGFRHFLCGMALGCDLYFCECVLRLRQMHPDVTVAYSWWSYRLNARKNNAGWRIDYFIVSDRLRDKIRRAEILSDVEGSDHCPVLLDIELD